MLERILEEENGGRFTTSEFQKENTYEKRRKPLEKVVPKKEDGPLIQRTLAAAEKLVYVQIA